MEHSLQLILDKSKQAKTRTADAVTEMWKLNIM